ncbi:hypothetical protein KIW84_054858 [Lathyrus oleraceus]|uniref:Uncharacterized protein n=1 Tax=Pisum sativum TaxID=3888 RepID=A0A9D4WWT3_PEA|nr:hypothetical protein KIW84_054858 [Pisum sativum]
MHDLKVSYMNIWKLKLKELLIVFQPWTSFMLWAEKVIDLEKIKKPATVSASGTSLSSGERSCLTFPPLGQVDGVEVQHEPLGGYISSYSKQIKVHAAEASIGATAQGVASILCAHGPEVERRICTIWEAAYGLIPAKSSAVDLPEIIVARQAWKFPLPESNQSSRVPLVHSQELHQRTIQLGHIPFGTRTCHQTSLRRALKQYTPRIEVELTNYMQSKKERQRSKSSYDPSDVVGASSEDGYVGFSRKTQYLGRYSVGSLDSDDGRKWSSQDSTLLKSSLGPAASVESEVLSPTMLDAQATQNRASDVVANIVLEEEVAECLQ